MLSTMNSIFAEQKPTFLLSKIARICSVVLVASCSSGGDDPESFVSRDQYVFATDGVVAVSAEQGVLANDSLDIESVAVQVNPHSTSSISLSVDGSFSYTPGDNLKTDSFTYIATTSEGESLSAKVDISIVRGIESCTLLDVLQTSSTTLKSRFLESDKLTFALSKSPKKGLVSDFNDKTGQATYVHDGQVRGRDSITFLVSDDYGGTAEVDFEIVNAPVRIMPLGDSLTEGVESNTEREINDPDLDEPSMNVRVGYRKSLYDSLIADGIAFDFVGSQVDAGFAVQPFDFEHEGHPGYSDAQISGISDPDESNTDEFMASTDGVYNWLNANPADVILLHAGTNNIGFRTSSVYIERTLDEISRWQSDKNYGAPVSVLVAQIIDKVPGSNESDNVSLFNANVESLVTSRASDSNDLTLVDMYHAVSQNLLDPLDQTHLTPQGYIKMAETWHAALKESRVLPDCQ